MNSAAHVGSSGTATTPGWWRAARAPAATRLDRQALALLQRPLEAASVRLATTSITTTTSGTISTACGWTNEYTCAYFPDPDMSLEEAQTAKMRHVCRKLALWPGERVVEAGSGWGTFALVSTWASDNWVSWGR